MLYNIAAAANGYMNNQILILSLCVYTLLLLSTKFLCIARVVVGASSCIIIFLSHTA